MTTFDHPLGEAHYDTYVPQDVPLALDAAEAAIRARLDLVATAAARVRQRRSRVRLHRGFGR
jgi:hypothetical protein